ncbi:MAG: lipase maturation factor family protein, partial [Candidatus Omnitrophica bacterium]|nr:lipase maturation factor family protein [Candidatus Omnitrophota bacterium]
KSSAAFIRILGIAYLVAFVSLWSQLTGLIGSSGILPASEFLTSIRAETGIERYWFVPTIFWLRAGDGILELACALGVLLSLFLIAGIASSPICLSLWILYLSLVTVGDDFLEFQWDNLLLEIGFLIIFLTPPKLWNKFSPQTPPSSMVLWLLRWLLFRLMFSSGMVKLVSGDPTWRNLTALQFHYETQPLPTWIGWFFHQLPLGFQKMSAVTMFGIELIIPFLFFMPKRIRYFGCGATLFLQILILLTGNYCFFNLLTIGLCILLLDDKFWSQKALEPEPAHPARWPQWIIASIAAIVLTVTGMQVSHLFWRRPAWPLPAVLLYRLVAPFRSMNSYGLFAVMTTKRPEIIIEGSHDGKTWSAYEFKWKPGDLKRRPQFVEPHQPRLDWQMWFAALGSYKHNPWFISLMRRLLEGSSDVLNLLAKNPFPDKPPKYVRALLYEYRFTDRETLRTTGNWWRRELKGLYCPVISLSRS